MSGKFARRRRKRESAESKQGSRVLQAPQAPPAVTPGQKRGKRTRTRNDEKISTTETSTGASGEPSQPRQPFHPLESRLGSTSPRYLEGANWFSVLTSTSESSLESCTSNRDLHRREHTLKLPQGVVVQVETRSTLWII